jgi:hypothetical protein
VASASRRGFFVTGSQSASCPLYQGDGECQSTGSASERMGRCLSMTLPCRCLGRATRLSSISALGIENRSQTPMFGRSLQRLPILVPSVEPWISTRSCSSRRRSRSRRARLGRQRSVVYVGTAAHTPMGSKQPDALLAAVFGVRDVELAYVESCGSDPFVGGRLRSLADLAFHSGASTADRRSFVSLAVAMTYRPNNVLNADAGPSMVSTGFGAGVWSCAVHDLPRRPCAG